MKTLSTILYGHNPTVISKLSEDVDGDQVDDYHDDLGLSLMYISDGIEMIDGLYQTIALLESTDEETRSAIAEMYDTIKDVTQSLQAKYDTIDVTPAE
jgi:hypothetical protein